MGLDTTVSLYNGFKIPLDIAFSMNMVREDIVDSDDFQCLDLADVVERNVSPELKRFLDENEEWNLYILTSSQEKSDAGKSWLFLYDKCQTLFDGRIKDYETGEVDTNLPLSWNVSTLSEEDCIRQLFANISKTLPSSLDLADFMYSMHWVVESSW